MKDDQANAFPPTDMKAKVFSSMIATVLVSGLFGFSALLKGSESNLAQASLTTQTSKFTTYVFPNEFSIQYPAGWFVERPAAIQPGGPSVMIQNLKFKVVGDGEVPRNMIKTDIGIVPGSFETVVNQAISEASTDDGGKLIRKGKLTIGGREAMRLWFTNSELGYEVIETLVPYRSDETAQIVSFYDKNNAAARRMIQTMHWSFRVID